MHDSRGGRTSVKPDTPMVYPESALAYPNTANVGTGERTSAPNVMRIKFESHICSQTAPLSGSLKKTVGESAVSGGPQCGASGVRLTSMLGRKLRISTEIFEINPLTLSDSA